MSEPVPHMPKITKANNSTSCPWETILVSKKGTVMASASFSLKKKTAVSALEFDNVISHYRF